MEKTYLITVTGRVQGVGFRPGVCRLAGAASLKGWVKNLGGTVEIRVTCEAAELPSFLDSLRRFPAPAQVETVQYREAPLERFDGFRAIPSGGTAKEPVFPADLGICPRCLEELHNPSVRHYGYPYISCPACGPRYTIVRKLPYDRENTTMDRFPFCPACGREYTDASDRRCHGETISCPDCGPQLSGLTGRDHLAGPAAMAEAIRLVRAGGRIPVPALGGTEVVCRGYCDNAVRQLRQLKQRDRKPFALMVPDLTAASALCRLTEQEQELLTSAVRPIVLAEPQEPLYLPAETAGHVPLLGLFLPPSGFYAMLTEGAGVPLIVTSCNRSGEPILFQDEAALAWYREHHAVAGFFTYDREILRSADDSVVKAAAGRVQVLRRTRGWLPEPAVRQAPEGCVLACGADMEPSFCLSGGGRLYPAQIPCELDNAKSERFLRDSEADWEAMLGITPECIVTDRHEGYLSWQWGRELAAARSIPLLTVQHHHAHALSVLAEHHLDGPCLAFVFDGTGAGPDGTVWGGEILRCHGAAMERVGHLQPIPMLGGDVSMKQAWKSALCYLAAAGIAEEDVADSRYPVVRNALAAGVNTLGNSSMGRLFDAAAVLLGLATENTFKGECPMALEAAAQQGIRHGTAPLPLALEPGQDASGRLVWNAAPLLQKLWEWSRRPLASKGREAAALGFHRAVVRLVADSAEYFGLADVVLSGGCFANGILLEGAVTELERRHFHVYTNEAVPCGDGGISLGQAYYGLLRRGKRK